MCDQQGTVESMLCFWYTGLCESFSISDRCWQFAAACADVTHMPYHLKGVKSSSTLAKERAETPYPCMQGCKAAHACVSQHVLLLLHSQGAEDQARDTKVWPDSPPTCPTTLTCVSHICCLTSALCRALKTKHETPKYGLIYHASLIGQSQPKFKGKISRVLAAKCALAIRVDALGDTTDAAVGTEARAKVRRAMVGLFGAII
jgi:hypothetical protein